MLRIQLALPSSSSTKTLYPPKKTYTYISYA